MYVPGLEFPGGIVAGEGTQEGEKAIAAYSQAQIFSPTNVVQNRYPRE